MITIGFTILLYWGLNHLEFLEHVLKGILKISAPFLSGGSIAFILNVPMKSIEGHLEKVIKQKAVLRFISMCASFILAFGIIVFVIMMVIPELVETIQNLDDGFPNLIGNLNIWIQSLSKNYPQITDCLESLEVNWSNVSDTVLGFLKSRGTHLLNLTWGMATSFIGGVTASFLGMVFAVYFLLQKEKLGMQTKKILCAYLPEIKVQNIVKVGKLTHRTFSGFISGQCMEAVLFGLLCYMGMMICRFPYAVSISVLIGFTTLVPVLGSFLGTALGAFLIFFLNPTQAIWFLAMILILQQIDGNLIYPRIMGNSVGVSGLWVMVGVTLGGSLMGVFGILLFVPLTSVIYTLLRENVYLRLRGKAITEEELENL